MSNSLGTITPSIIAQQSLEILADSFPIITAFSTDFSNEPGFFNSAINTRIPLVSSAADYDTTNGYVATAYNNTNVALTLNKHRHVSVSFTDQELSSTPLNLIEQSAKTVAASIANDIASGIFTLFTTGNFSTSVALTSGVAVTRATLAAQAKKSLDTNNVPFGDRMLINNPTIQYELLSDSNVFLLTAGGVGNSASSIPNLVGFKVEEYTALPTTSNMVSVAAHKNAVVVASRSISLPPDNIPNNALISNFTDAKTGFTVQMRLSYDPGKGKTQVTYAYLLGYALGNPKSAVLFTRAGG